METQDLNKPEKSEECGLIGILYQNHADEESSINAAALTATTLQALQHRGEEAAGVTSSNGKYIKDFLGLGVVKDVFKHQEFSGCEEDFLSIGHTRYSVTGKKNQKNIQPLLVNHLKGQFAVAHNGNLSNSVTLKKQLENAGAIFQTGMDSEIFTHLIAKSKKKTFEAAIIDAAKKTKGAFCLLVMTKEKIYAIRDAHGFHPLCWGEVNGTKVISSETCALDLIGAKYRGQIAPGEMMILEKGKKIIKKKVLPTHKESKCIFELIYFSRPDSLIFGESVYQFRKQTGITLAQEAPVDADIVIPIPDSGIHAAIGYAQASKIPMEMAITKNHYIGRSFIQPTQAMRDHFVKLKLNPIKNMVNKKSVILVDDSIVRGTTTKRKIKAIRNAGAREIHMRVAAPPIKNPCFYGIDFPNKEQLIANNLDLEATRKFLGLDSLAYISIKGLLSSSEQATKQCGGFCTACFSGKYPTAIPKNFSKEIFEY